MAASSMRSAPSARVVSMTGASPVTTTSSCTRRDLEREREVDGLAHRQRDALAHVVAKPAELTLTR